MKKNNFISRYAAFFLIVTLFGGIVTSCTEKDSDIVKPKTITDVILQNSEFSTLREIILANDLGDALRTENITLFAPNNAAFLNSKITSAQINAMPKDSIRAFVYRHILKQNLTFESLKVQKYPTILKGDSIVVTQASADAPLQLNKLAYVITKNVNADNGSIQVVDHSLKNIK
ncbi:fasciclin domain-containing protein [Dyadobacter sp. CY356]|uniref:fasciclin domain-containing protein n=1 Tax=Dyadobacter sp. CY356 TaxID=2906442 RepID=UPI001F1DF539|nr:fasciclin domain-containing protein [Dyadobacter sp. CY356]MCF0057504.1 fasciclin domain-containing protein [Dyadobacter sp. CY356]